MCIPPGTTLRVCTSHIPGSPVITGGARRIGAPVPQHSFPTTGFTEGGWAPAPRRRAHATRQMCAHSYQSGTRGWLGRWMHKHARAKPAWRGTGGSPHGLGRSHSLPEATVRRANTCAGGKVQAGAKVCACYCTPLPEAERRPELKATAGTLITSVCAARQLARVRGTRVRDDKRADLRGSAERR